MNWYAVAVTLSGGFIALAGLMGWHIAHGDLYGLWAAVLSAGCTWIAGNLLVEGKPGYAASMAGALAFFIASFVLAGV